jgi:DNA-binding NarL/FixJ family response regulator
MLDSSHSQQSSATLKVILADDHIKLLDGVKKLLAPEHSVVACVNNGRLALEATLEFRPDLVVLDIEMPEMDGIQAAREMRRLGLETRILFLTVHGDEDYIAIARMLGNGYVLKSRMATDLRKAIREAMADRFFISQQILEDE